MGCMDAGMVHGISAAFRITLQRFLRSKVAGLCGISSIQKIQIATTRWINLMQEKA